MNQNVVYLAEYSIWSVPGEKVYRSKIADVDKLKKHVWSNSVIFKSLESLLLLQTNN